MGDFITSDRTLKVGDLVFSNYHKGQLLFKITEIQRRFIDSSMLQYNCYQGGSVGDEHNPEVTIESVADLGITVPKKKFRKTVKCLDASWVVKVEPEHISAHIKRLNEILSTHWP